jgi:hypothetical protein
MKFEPNLAENIMKIIYTFLIALLLLGGCASNQKSKYEEWPPSCYRERILPPGNIAKLDTNLNTEDNDIAPVQRPIVKTGDFSQCSKEFEAEKQSPADGVNASTYFVQDTFQLVNRENPDQRLAAYKYLTENIESITFLDRTRGFVSFSHPPSKSFAKKIGLPISGVTGGTDIFEFKLLSEDNFIFENVQPVNKVNTEFWDSHPFAYYLEKDGNRYTVLLWASDEKKPYSYADSISKGRTIRGTTNIYYIIRNESNGKWSEPRMLGGDINMPDSYEGSPFVYCSCLNPVLVFSSNRTNRSPGIVEEKFKEDFDLYYVRLSIDIINNELLISPVENAKRFRKGSEISYFNESGKPDSTINTNSDERFPFIPYPVSKEDDNYIYFSSNRNQNLSDYGDTDSVVVNRGKYDIYRFALPDDFPSCKPVPKKVNVEVYVLNAVTGERIPDAFVKLNYGTGQMVSNTGINPARFDSLEIGKQYQITGGTKYRSINNEECGDRDTVYYSPAKIKHMFIEKLDETLEMKDYIIPVADFQNIKNTIKYDTIKTEKYINTFKYNVTEIISEEPVGKPEFIDDNFDNVKLKYKITKKYITEPYEGLKSTNKLIDFMPKSSEDVKAGNIESEYTMNDALHTNGLPNGALIRDTVYLVPQINRVNCIDLTVVLKDVCTGNDVLNPAIRVVEYDTEKDMGITVENGYIENDTLKLQLKTNKTYRIMGGSNFTDISECPDMLFYIDARADENCNLRLFDLKNIPYSGNEIARDANILSINSYSNGYFDTRNINKDTSITEVIELKPVYFQKPECEHYFTELQDSLHRRVPYFQTAFWEINTKENLEYFYPKLTNSNRLYGDPYTIKKGEFEDCEECMNENFSGEFWPGAKWIELHENNTDYIGSAGRRYRRYQYYKDAADKVESNLNNMVDIISNRLIPSFELLNTVDKDYGMKLFIRVEAWSDFRPVCCGWYIAKNDKEKTINFAECSNINDFDGEMPKFESFIIKDGQALGSRNNVLSQLRAYFGYMELYNRMLENPNFKKYADKGEVLLPHDLVDGNGNLLAQEMLDYRISKSRIIFITKGYDTNPVDEKPWYFPKYIITPEDAIKIEKQRGEVTQDELSEVRTIQVFSKIRKYEKGIGFTKKCCEEVKINK